MESGCQPKNRGTVAPPKWMFFFLNGKPYEQKHDLGVKIPIFLVQHPCTSGKNGGTGREDLFKDTCDAHLMGPQGLSTWRIGIEARPLKIGLKAIVFFGNQWVFIVPKNKAGYLLGVNVALGGGGTLDSHDFRCKNVQQRSYKNSLKTNISPEN